GIGEINDRNDFGQLMVWLIPMLFIFWRQNKTIKNIMFVFLPIGVLLLGVFLTHSRGALVALTLIAVVAARRRIGTLPAMLLAGGLFVAAMALRFTGGRGISASEGEDRTGLWGEGMQIVRAHPLLGVGYGDLWERTEGYLTAHNSVVVCAAELGMVGLFFWSLYIFSTMRDAVALASPGKVCDGEPIVIEEGPLSYAALPPEEIGKTEINQMGWAMVLSLLGFLAAGWFLSRAFVATLFLLGGLTEAVYEMAVRRGMIAPRLKLVRVILYSGVLAFALLLIVYVMIRVLNLMH
ncbi:MAG: O-antigen ligase family protein, partial [Acidobacteriaceae bacterium]|nr:O-antigen ligase family protein [Acidobacteriaceae bacterium]